MQVLTLLSKMLDCPENFDIWQNEDCTVYTCYFGDFVAEEIESIADVDKRRDYSVTFKANADCHFEVVAIGYDEQDGTNVERDVRERIHREMKSRGLLEIYYTFCEEAVRQV